MLDIPIALRRPSDYEPKDGARFKVHIEKARGLFGVETDLFEARLQADAVGNPTPHPSVCVPQAVDI